MDWKNLDSFPSSPGGWVARTSFGRRDLDGEKAVRKILKRWHPYTMTLVSVPGQDRLLPALEMAETRPMAHRALVKRARLCLFTLLLYFVILFMASVLTHRPAAYTSTELIAAIGLFSLFDYLLILRNPDALAERALFAYYVRMNGKVDAALWALLMIFVGAVQYLVDSRMGTDGLIMTYGVYFPTLNASGAWRLITGPLLHGSVIHWMSNLVMLVFMGIISGAISRRDTIWLFFAGSAVGALASFFLSPYTHYEAYVGISAGITAMLGFCIGAAWRSPKDFPKRFAFTLMAFAIMDIYLSWIAAANASNEGHIAGLFLGLLWGCRKSVDYKPSSVFPSPARN